MLNNRTDKMRLLKCLIDCIFILTFIGLIITSRSLAQWPPYNNYTSPFFNPILSLSISPYTNSFTSSLFPSVELSELENFDNLHPFVQDFYETVKDYNPFSPNALLPLFYDLYNMFSYPNPIIDPFPWEGLHITLPQGVPLSLLPPPPPLSVKIPYPESPDPIPMEAPTIIAGGWQSLLLTDGNGNKIKGNLAYDQPYDLLKILDNEAYVFICKVIPYTKTGNPLHK